MIQPSRRPLRPVILTCVALFLIVVILTAAFHEPLKQTALSLKPRPHNVAQEASIPSTGKRHFLLPSSKGSVDLCKTILTSAILGFPAPTLIAWNETFDKGHLLGGGSHVAKISGVLEYLQALEPASDNDLVLMMDAYDIWMQLPFDVLLSRYHAINARANRGLSKRLGHAYTSENIRQTIIFGAGKRCTPNEMHTVACYPLPPSPIPDDVYGNNTDTVLGKNRWSLTKQRYLNSGYIIGPVSGMRRMFERAMEKVEKSHEKNPWDNGSGESGAMYRGSDQSVFNTIFGEQEYVREVKRRKYLSRVDRWRGRQKTRPTALEGTVVDDPLNPSFTHEIFEPEDGKEYEFGIGLDYFSEIGHQTINSEDDARYLRYKESIDEQLKDRKGLFICDSRVTGELPSDLVAHETVVGASTSWNELPLFSNLCLNTVPAMIHHNGDKGARAWQWPKTWMQPHARRLLETVLQNSEEDVSSNAGRSQKPTGGAFLTSGMHLPWGELCPVEYEWELFRDVEKPEHHRA